MYREDGGVRFRGKGNCVVCASFFFSRRSPARCTLTLFHVKWMMSRSSMQCVGCFFFFSLPNNRTLNKKLVCVCITKTRVIFASKFLLFFFPSATYGFSLNLCKEKKSVSFFVQACNWRWPFCCSFFCPSAKTA